MGFIKEFLKKYAALLPSIGLLVVAVVLLLPTVWLRGKVQAQMDTSVKQAQTIRSLRADVPSKDTLPQIKSYMDRLENEVKQIEAVVEQSSQRELISYTIFPMPQDTSSQVFSIYGKNYQTAIEGLLTGMNALDAPTEAEIRTQTGTGGARSADGMGGTGRRPVSQDPMVDALCAARADRISIYAAPSAFAWYDFWQKFKFDGTDPALLDCWNSQIALWIYEDIVKTIQTMNIGSSKVADSPVKRLLGVSFSGPVQVSREQGSMSGIGRPMGMPGMMGPGQSMSSMRDNPNYVSSLLQSNFLQTPWTGRIGGPDYDVIHFAVSVVVDNRRVLDFMRELCSEKEHTFREDFKEDGRLIQSRHNQVTILQNSVAVVAKDDPAHELYRYGNGAAMRLDLVCEYLLSRKGYEPIMPVPVKQLLDGQQPGTAPGAAPAAPYGMPTRPMPMF